MNNQYEKGQVVVCERGVQLVACKCKVIMDTRPPLYRMQWSVDNPREWTGWLDWFSICGKLRHVYGSNAAIVYRKDA